MKTIPTYLEFKKSSIDLKSKCSFPYKTKKKETIRLLANQNAADCIKDLTRDVGIFGFTKGQFSLINLIEKCVEKIGPCHLQISTWVASKSDISEVMRFFKAKKILSIRFLIDFSFQSRQPGLVNLIRDEFGIDSIRLTRNHAKFFLLKNETWDLTCKTSMNLNGNPRFEDFDVCNDIELFNFINAIMDEIFSKISGESQVSQKSNGLWNQWQKLKLNEEGPPK